MKKALMLIVLVVAIASLAAQNFSYSGELRTRGTMYNDVSVNSKTTSYIDSRLHLTLENKMNENLKAVAMFEIGDIVWGDALSGGGLDTRGTNVETANLYVDYLCPVTNMNAKVGLFWWGDHQSLVFDDDWAGISLSKKVLDNYSLEIGLAKETDHKTTNSDNSDVYFAAFTNDNMGVQALYKNYNNGNSYDFWLLPYYSTKFNEIDLDAVVGITMGRDDAADVDNFGWAISAKMKMQAMIDLGMNVLITSGDDQGQEKTFKSLGNCEWYFNGLQIFGRGIHTDANVSWNGAENGGYGLIQLVLTGSKQMTDMTRVHGAIGMTNTMAKKNDETYMGSEVDLGAEMKLYEALHFDIVGAYAIPGDALAKDIDDLYQLSGVLTYKF